MLLDKKNHKFYNKLNWIVKICGSY